MRTKIDCLTDIYLYKCLLLQTVNSDLKQYYNLVLRNLQKEYEKCFA